MRAPVLVLSAFIAARAAPAEVAPRPHVDREAMREARGDGPVSSARAIAHYLQARQCQERDDWPCAAAELELAATFDEQSADLREALAEALAMAGNLARAEAEARRAAELAGGAGPIASRAHVLLAQIAAGRSREQAVLELRQAVHIEVRAAEGGGAPDPEPWRLLAVLYLEMGDEQAASRALDDLASRAPRESAAFREAGRWLLERHRPRQAERWLRRAVEAAREDVQAWRLLARTHQELGRGREVEDDLRALLEAQPDDPDALFGLGAAALRASDVPHATDLFARFVNVAADRAQAAVQVSGEWIDAGRPEDALEGVRAAHVVGEPEPRLLLAEGIALQRLRRWTDAARVLRQLQESDGELYLRARVALAEVLSRAGRSEEALRALAAPLQARRHDVRLVIAQAEVLERAARTRQAITVLERAASAHELADEEEDAAELWAARAALTSRAGRPAEAATALQPMLAARPRSATLRLALAAALRASGAPARAVTELRALLALEPEHPEALALLATALVDVARTDPAGAAGPGSREEAEALARRAAELRPRSAEAFWALGRVRSLRGDHAGAVAALERAVALSGRQARFLDDLGEAYLAAGRSREAAAAWRQALASAADEVPPVAARLRTALQHKLGRSVREVAEQGIRPIPAVNRRIP